MARIRRTLPVAGRQHDLEFDELIPLSIGALPFRHRQQLLQAAARGNWLWIVHGGIISSFGISGLAISDLPRNTVYPHVHPTDTRLR